MKFHPGQRPRYLAAFLSFPLLLISPTSASTHDDDHHRIQGSKLKMKDDAGDSSRRLFVFKSKGQLAINASIFDKDPRLLPSHLIVRGTGLGAGESGVVHLDPTGWRAVGAKGFAYRGDPDSSSGVQRIKLKNGSAGGSLTIKARGASWSYAIPVAQGVVDVALTVGPDVYCARYDDDAEEMTRNEAGRVAGKSSTPPPDCEPVCRNGVLELGESCDDGNDDPADTCDNSCGSCATAQQEFQSTYAGLQSLIFDSPVFGCSTVLCHGSSTQGSLDLRVGVSYAELVGTASAIEPSTLLVFPGDQDLSLLYNKIAAKTLGEPTVPGAPMPASNATVSAELLEAMRLWIRGGAPATGVVEGTAGLLGACLPDPDPLKIPRPDPPAPGEGIQLAMPAWDLASQAENEVCVATYYDFTDPAIVPSEFRVPCVGMFPGTNDPPAGTGECFSYDGNTLSQDPQSHHSLVYAYAGDHDRDHSGWGSWRCYLGDDDGQPCDPTSSAACPGGVCGGSVVESVACTFYGPPDFSNLNNNQPQWSGSQEPVSSFPLPNGVYNLLPLKGVIVWNSHAFNLTDTDTNMEAWINVSFTDDRQFVAEQLFNDDFIFAPSVPPFETSEICYTHTFDEGTRLFQLSSHMHRRGKRWRYYLPPQTQCVGPTACTAGAAGDIFYESFDYSDPVVMNLDPSMVFTGSDEDRTIKFCALYDNGATDPADVKTRSGSPCPPSPALCGGGFGGPCHEFFSACMGGPNMGEFCLAQGDAACPDSYCDACTLEGGVTTEDEMFIATGLYFVTP